MTRKEQLEYCTVCKNRKMDFKRGLVCSLTDDYADFDPVCENYAQDVVEKQSKSIENEVNKGGGLIGILWLLIPIAAFFVFLSCLLIPTWSALVYIVLGLNVLAIAAIIVFNVLYLKKLYKKKDADSNLTIDKIMDYIRKEGYYPQKVDKSIVFKIQGEPFEVFYSHDGLFYLIRRYLLNKEDKPAAEKAAFATMASTRLIKIYTMIDDDYNWLVFDICTYETSSSGFEHRFSHYMEILLESINRHRYHFTKIAEESVKEETPIPKIGFPTNSSNVKS